MMQVQELAANGLKREFKITVEQSEIEKNMLVRLEEIGRTARLDGFRPGKVPMPVLRKRYGEAVLGEVIEKTVGTTADKAISDRGLRTAMKPKVEMEEVGQNKPLTYKLAFEVLPEISIGDFKQVKLEKLLADVADSEVDSMIERMGKSARGPESVAEARAAQQGDVLLIDFEGMADGKPHPGMKGSNHRLELGSKSFIDSFEEQLVGKKKGDDVTVKVTFPAAYHAIDLAGKPAEFKVKIKDIMAHTPLVLNDALASEIGFKTIEELRTKVRERMQADHTQISREVMKRQLLDQLADTYDFAVPQGLVEAEFQSIWTRVQEEKAKGIKVAEDVDKNEDEQRNDYREISERRVRLGLLLAELGRAKDIKVEQTELRDALIAETRQYPGQEKEVFEYFTKTPGALDRLRAPILEEKVIDYIIGQTTVTEKKVSVEELRATPDKMDAEIDQKPAKAKKKKTA
ncbi:MAG: trigger factor [Alphaproteobacteria bacterium]